MTFQVTFLYIFRGVTIRYHRLTGLQQQDYSGDEIRDYWLYSMEQARNVMPCYRPAAGTAGTAGRGPLVFAPPKKGGFLRMTKGGEI